MTQIILVRHAPTIPDKSYPADQWMLTDKGQNLCQNLAQQLASYDITKIYTSHEAKAISTGNYIAQSLGNIDVIMQENLHETERQSNLFYETNDDFKQAVHQAMIHPDTLLFGDEIFNQAKMRLQKSLAQLAKNHPNETIIAVTHGRILAMFLADVMQLSPVYIWQKLKMPAYAVLSWQNQTIEKIVYDIKEINHDD